MSHWQIVFMTNIWNNFGRRVRPMAKKFADLRAQMKPEARQRAEEAAQTLLSAMPLNELRQARGLSQKMLAEVLHVQQPSIAKIEKRTDMYLSTLRSHIEAMGGELEIIARFPDGSVKISNFSDLGNTPSV
jgi:DNA-binding transcriptional regulator YiaG